MGMGVVASFLDPTEADIAASALRSAGFNAVAMDRHFSTVDWMVVQSLGGIRVGVPDGEVDDAARLLGQLIGERPEPSPPTERGAGWYFLAIVVGVLAILALTVFHPGSFWLGMLLLAGAYAPWLGWTVLAAARGHDRSSQLPGILLVLASFLALAIVLLGLGWLFAELPHLLYPDGRTS
jgi:hypothetical protein